MIDKELNERLSMEVIAYSGDAKSYGYAALEAIKNKNKDLCDIYLQKSNDSLIKAQQAQSQILDNNYNNKLDIDLLVLHSQDQLLSTIATIDLIKELIEVHQILHKIAC